MFTKIFIVMSLYNADELEAPKWVDRHFLEKVLKNCENIDNVEIIEYDLTPASVKGDHYASIMLRCKVKYRLGGNRDTKEMSLVIKTLPSTEGMKRDMLMETNVFETEIKMYTETLPCIQKMLAECGEHTKLAANIYYHSLDPHKVVVFEDLCESGYDTVRARYLTENEVKAVYTKIAQLHAASFILGHCKQHEIVTKYQEGTFSGSFQMVKDLLVSGFRNFIDLLNAHEEFYIYIDKFNAMKGNIEQACKDLFKAYTLNNDKGENIFVLNHGDFHMKNLMFKFDSNKKLVDLTMVDYQMCCYAPSIIDITYSQYMILSPELRMKRHVLMHHYFTEFIRVLKKLNYHGELPKYEVLQKSAFKYRHFAIFLVAAFLPFVSGLMSKSLDELKDMDPTKLLEDHNVSAGGLYSSPEYKKDLQNFLPILLKEGFLDS